MLLKEGTIIILTGLVLDWVCSWHFWVSGPQHWWLQENTDHDCTGGVSSLDWQLVDSQDWSDDAVATHYHHEIIFNSIIRSLVYAWSVLGFVVVENQLVILTHFCLLQQYKTQ